MQEWYISYLFPVAIMLLISLSKSNVNREQLESFVEIFHMLSYLRIYILLCDTLYHRVHTFMCVHLLSASQTIAMKPKVVCHKFVWAFRECVCVHKRVKLYHPLWIKNELPSDFLERVQFLRAARKCAKTDLLSYIAKFSVVWKTVLSIFMINGSQNFAIETRLNSWIHGFWSFIQRFGLLQLTLSYTYILFKYVRNTL